jgi:hypothetical protein
MYIIIIILNHFVLSSIIIWTLEGRGIGGAVALTAYTTRKIAIGGIVFRGVHKFLYATAT